MTSIAVDADGSGVVFEFQDADGDDYFGVIAPGIRRIVGPHPTAVFESITVVPAPSANLDRDPAEAADWIRRQGEQAVRSTAAHRAWEACSGRELPDDQAFTVSIQADGSVTSQLLVPCDGLDAELVHTRRPTGSVEVELRICEETTYVPSHLREVVQAGLPHVVSGQTGEPVQITAGLMDEAARRTLESPVYRAI